MLIKHLLKWLILISFVLIGGYFVAEWQMKIAVQDFLQRKIPNHIDFGYEGLEINLVKGNLVFSKAKVSSQGRQTSSCEIHVEANALTIKGFSYWKFFKEDSIFINSLALSDPFLNFVSCATDTINEVNAPKPINLLKPITIKNLVFEKGKIEIWNSNKDVALLSVKSINLAITNIYTDSIQIKKYIPVVFTKYDLAIDNVLAPVGAFENLHITNVNVNNDSIVLKQLLLNTKFAKNELSKKINVERDHIRLEIPKLSIKNHTYAFINDSLSIDYKYINIKQPRLDLYRDKKIIDNMERRPLFSELLRNMSTYLSIDSLEIEKGTISYEENADNNVKAGLLTFENLDCTIRNLSNITSNEKNVNISLNTDLMGSGAFQMNWEFNVHDPHERFLVTGGLQNFNTSYLNDFLVPNLRTKTEGFINQMYFTVSGDEYVANGDLKIKYEDFKIHILNKDRSHVNKVLSFIGNLFINNGSKANDNGYRFGTITTQRPRNKSFFNYLWVSLENGLKNALTGNGEK